MPSCARCVTLWPAAIAPSNCSCAFSTRRSRVSLPERGANSTPSAAPTPAPTANAETDSVQLCFAVMVPSIFRASYRVLNFDLRSGSLVLEEKLRGGAASEPPLPSKLRPAARSCVARALILCLDVSGRFTCGGNILGVGNLHDFFGAFDRFRAVAVHGQQDAALLYASFIALGLIFRDAEADQRAGESANGAADTDASQGSHNRASRDEWTDARYGQRANSSQQTQRAAQDRAGACSSCRTFRCFCRFFSPNLPGSEIFRKQRRNLARGESGSNQRVGGVIRARQSWINYAD